MIPDDALMRYWLEHEYAESMKPYLVCTHPESKAPFGQQELLPIDPDSISRQGDSPLWWVRPRQAPSRHVRFLMDCNQKVDYGGVEERDLLANGHGLELVACQISRLKEKMVEQDLQNLLQLCMGAQYFTVLTSDYFPCSSQLAVKLCLFYAHVVLGEHDLATQIYRQHQPYIDSICCRLNSTAGLIFANIRCLYFLRTGFSARYILPVNQSLVEHSKLAGHKILTGILLLNQARLCRILGDFNSSISLLEETFSKLSHIPSFKLRLYLVLQLASITRDKNRVVQTLNNIRRAHSDSYQCFGWRIAKLLEPEADADMLLGEWSSFLSEVFLSGTSLSSLLRKVTSLQ